MIEIIDIRPGDVIVVNKVAEHTAARLSLQLPDGVKLFASGGELDIRLLRNKGDRIEASSDVVELAGEPLPAASLTEDEIDELRKMIRATRDELAAWRRAYCDGVVRY